MNLSLKLVLQNINRINTSTCRDYRHLSKIPHTLGAGVGVGVGVGVGAGHTCRGSLQALGRGRGSST